MQYSGGDNDGGCGGGSSGGGGPGAVCIYNGFALYFCCLPLVRLMANSLGAPFFPL